MTTPEPDDTLAQKDQEAPALPSSDSINMGSPLASKTQPEQDQTPANPRLQALQRKHATALATLTELKSQKAELVAKAKLQSGLSMPDDWSEEQRTKQAMTTANAVIKEHIALLHKYNEIKDIGQGLMGMIAESRGVRVIELMEEFGMSEKD